MIYLKLYLNQDQEWSPVTISSLAKMLVGVNNIVVENLDFSADKNEIIISARPYKRDQCRCGICGRKAPGYVPDRINVISAGAGSVDVKLRDTTAEADFANGVLWISEIV